MLGGKPLFAGTSTMNQLDKIMEVTGEAGTPQPGSDCRSPLPRKRCLSHTDAGRPTREDVEAIQSPFAADMLESLPSGEPLSLADMFPCASPDAIDLMGKLLHFNPNKRITAQEALEHPYLQQFHDKSQEPEAASIITIPINDNTKVCYRPS